MKRIHTIILTAAISAFAVPPSAPACTWAAFANGGAAVVARTVDWYCSDGAVVKGCGRNVKVKAAPTPNALEYTAKYASIQIHSFADGLVSDAMNEKGLQGAILYLDGSALPAVRSDRKDVDPYGFIAYAVSTCATVREVVDALDRINFIPMPNFLPGADGEQLADKPENWPYHYALADATGDRVIIEFAAGKMNVYHGADEDALTNEPTYDVHKAIEEFGYRPDPSIATIARRARARQYLKAMRERGVDSQPRALMAMRGLLASVFAGIEEVDPVDNETYPTQWWGLADQVDKRYYITRLESWCTEVYDFSMFDPGKAEVVTLTPAGCPHPAIGRD